MRPRKYIWIFAPVILVAGTFAMLGTMGSSVEAGSAVPRDDKRGEQPAGKNADDENGGVFTVTTADIDGSILVTGELKAARSRDINAPEIRSMFGTTITYMALEGTEAKQGERILEFDATTLLSQKSEAERVLDEAKLKIDKTKADLEVQRSDLLMECSTAEANLKVAQLYAKIDKPLLPANTYQKYQLDLVKAQLAMTKAQERLANLVDSIPAQLALVEVDRAQAEINLKKIEGDLARMQVDAPQDGIIIYGDNWANSRKFQVGDTAFRGMTVMSLPDLSSMQVVAYVYDTELRYLSANMICDLSLDAVPGRQWKGRIVSLTSVANRKGFASQHKVFRAVIDLDRADLNVMKPGMTVKVEVPVSFAAQVLAVPREYVGLDGQGQYYVHKGSTLKTVTSQPVQVGNFSDRLIQISSGISVGDRLLPIRRAEETKR